MPQSPFVLRCLPVPTLVDIARLGCSSGSDRRRVAPDRTSNRVGEVEAWDEGDGNESGNLSTESSGESVGHVRWVVAQP